MRFGSLFSGIGGLDLGLERAGMSCAWQVEIDPDCRRVLAQHFPRARLFGDVRDVRPTDLEPVDLICGGYPCQPFSLAGKRLGADDPRHLWPYFRAIVRQLKPRWVVGENVRGHVSKGLAEVVSDLAQIGYDAEWDVLSAAQFGAPHLRERVFIVGRLAADADGGGFTREQERDGAAQAEQKVQQSKHALRCGMAVSADGVRWRGCGPWSLESPVFALADGIPERLAGLPRRRPRANRCTMLRVIGNAVVPQAAEWVGRRIMEVEAARGRLEGP